MLTRGEALGLAAYAALSALVFALCYRAPHYNWDVIGYTAGVLEGRFDSAAALHRETYAAVQAWSPPEPYSRLLNGEFRRANANDPEALRQVLPYYRIRVLYLLAVGALAGLGWPVASATAAVAAICAWGVALLVAWWLARSAPVWPALAVAAAMPLGVGLLDLARLSTPDSMAALLVVAAFFAALHLRRPWAALGCFYLAVWTRTDTVLFLLAWLAVGAAWRGDANARLRHPQALIAAAAGVAMVFLIGRLAGGYGGWMTFYSEFIRLDPYPETGEPPLDLREVLAALVRSWRSLLQKLHIGLVPMLALLLWPEAWRQRRPEPILLIATSALCFVAKLLLHPSPELRHYVVNLVLLVLAAGLLWLPERRAVPLRSPAL